MTDEFAAVNRELLFHCAVVVHGRADVESPWEIASFLELKTIFGYAGVAK